MKKHGERFLLACLRAAVEAAQAKKAGEIAVLDLQELTSITGYFLICHGSSRRQVQAIADAIEERLRERKVRPAHVEGASGADWVLMDYLDFVVHVFTEERRAFYSLERLWAEAPRLDLGSSSDARRLPARRPRA